MCHPLCFLNSAFCENRFLWGCQACSLSVHLICRGALGHFTALELGAQQHVPAESFAHQHSQELAGNTWVCCDSSSTAKPQSIGVHPRSSGIFLGQDLIICICMYLFTASSPRGGFYGKASKCVWKNKCGSHSCSAEPVCFMRYLQLLELPTGSQASPVISTEFPCKGLSISSPSC